MKNITVVGLGYVGLPVAIAIAETNKYKVIGFDIDQNKIDKINDKVSPFYDEDITKRLPNVELTATTNPEDLADTEIFLVCVPTPVEHDFEPNLRPLKSAIKTISPYINKGDHVVVESTINPGVCDEVVIPLLNSETGMTAGVDFNVAHCPERINPGDTKWTIYNIPRNIGSTTPEFNKEIAEFYRSFVNAEIKEVKTLKVAEATKIVENTFRDINIAFVNELAKSFEAMGIDVVETIEGAANKPFGFMPHWPGIGVGGHCIPVDPYYLIKRAAASGFNHRFLKLAREINNSMPEFTVDILAEELNQLGLPVKGTKVGLYGLSYKANVGDLRESPSLIVKEELERLGADLKVYDPFVADMSDVGSIEELINSVDVLLVATDHREIKEYDINNFKKLKLVLDAKNCLNEEAIENLNINFKGIGR